LNATLNIQIISTFDTGLSTFTKVPPQINTILDKELNDLQKGYLDYKLNIGKRKDAIIENEASENIKEKIAQIQAPQARFLEMIDELFSETNKKVDRDKNEVSFLLANTKEIQNYQLSSGEKQVLLILLTTLLQDHKPTIFFLDEPEISLHVEWQKKLIDFIRELNPNAQIIIATHSPAMIMNGWRKHVFNMHNLLTPIA
jgi:predicted ATPase